MVCSIRWNISLVSTVLARMIKSILLEPEPFTAHVTNKCHIIYSGCVPQSVFGGYSANYCRLRNKESAILDFKAFPILRGLSDE